MGIVYFLSFVHIYIKAQQPLLVMDLKNTELDDLFQKWIQNSTSSGRLLETNFNKRTSRRELVHFLGLNCCVDLLNTVPLQKSTHIIH